MTIENIICEPPSDVNKNDRRVLTSIFNDDLDGFVARQVKVTQINENNSTDLNADSMSGRAVLYLAKGEGEFVVRDPISNQIISYQLTPKNRLYLPNGTFHSAHITPGSILIQCMEKEPEKYNNEDFHFYIKGFEAKQVKVAEMLMDSYLGGHDHTYDEGFLLYRGEGDFLLKSIHNREASEEKYHLSAGKTILIPKDTTHSVNLNQGAILIGLTTEKYISPEKNDLHRG